MRLGFKFRGSWPVFSFRKVIRSERFWWEQQRAEVPAPQPLLGQGKKDWSQLSATQHSVGNKQYQWLQHTSSHYLLLTPQKGPLFTYLLMILLQNLLIERSEILLKPQILK